MARLAALRNLVVELASRSDFDIADRKVSLRGLCLRVGFSFKKANEPLGASASPSHMAKAARGPASLRQKATDKNGATATQERNRDFMLGPSCRHTVRISVNVHEKPT